MQCLMFFAVLQSVSGVFIRGREGAVAKTITKGLARAETRMHKSMDLVHSIHASQRDAHAKNDPSAATVLDESRQRYVSTGCMEIDMSSVSLGKTEGKKYDSSEGPLTLETCYYFCVEHKSIWMLVTNGNECVCGDVYSGEDSEGCDTPCEGNGEEKCGGTDVTEAYLLTSWVPKLVSKACGPPPVIPDVESSCLDGGGEELPATCDITCNSGFIVGENAMMCDGSTGEWFGHAFCKEVLCALPPPIPNSVMTCQGATMNKPDCSVECFPGFTLESNTLACYQPSIESATGLYEGEALCKPIGCGLPPAMDFALYNGDMEALYPALVDYTCMKGFTQDGSASGLTSMMISCEESGSFTALSGKCQPIKCGLPPLVEKAVAVSTDPVFFQSVAEYTCDAGYFIGGLPSGGKSVMMDCTALGTFAEAEPCEPVICGVAPQLPFATTVHDPTAPLSLSEVVKYTCDEGFAIDAKDRSKRDFMAQCDEEGQFAGISPCHRVDCEHPEHVANAMVAEVDMVYQLVATYMCVAGHSVDGTVLGARTFDIDCKADQTLSSAKECLPIDCGEPPSVQHRTLTEDVGHHFGLAVNYKCDEGFSTDTTPSPGAALVQLSCLESGQYAEALPCVEIDDCASVTCGPYGECIDEHMGYHCECQSGFEVQEVEGAPMCGNIDDCGDCGAGTCEDLVNDFTCHCPSGYELVEDPEKTCSPVLCGDPPAVEFAVRPDGKMFFLSNVEYACGAGTSLDATAVGLTSFIVDCSASKAFVGAKECKKIECGTPPPVASSTAEERVHVFNETATYDCATGHSTDGMAGGEVSFGVTCMEAATWAEPQACLPVSCGAPPPLFAAAVDATPLTFEQDAIYMCEEGHSTDGSAAETALTWTVTCEADGRLSGLQECVAMNCGAPPQREKAHATVEEAMVYPLPVEYICEEGYTLDGALSGAVKYALSCGPNGEFVGDVEATCQPISCEPIEVMEATASAEGPALFPSEVTYECAHGFAVDAMASDGPHVSPEGAITSFALSCLPNGQFSPPPACKNINDCEGRTCGAHGTCVDEIGDYTCDCMEGFELNVKDNGDKICGNVDDCKDHKCGAYGVCMDFTGGYTCQCTTGYGLMALDGDHSTCEAMSCGELPTIEHATHDRSDIQLLKFPDSVLYVCEHGYSTTGTPTPTDREFLIACPATGEMSPPSACHPVVCGVPPQVPYATTAVSMLEPVHYGTELSYACEEGHSLDGTPGGSVDFTLGCSADAIIAEPPVCMPKNCGDPPAVEHASMSTGVMYPAKALYECAPGYSMDGTAAALSFELACESSGSFAALDAAHKCQKVTCGAPPVVENAEYDSAELFAGDAVIFVCHEGFSSSGTASGLAEFSTVCGDDGLYTAMPAVNCAMITVSVSGQIKDATNNVPIAQTTLTAIQHFGGQEKRTVIDTDANGIYNLALGLGEVTLESAKTGYITATKNVFLSSNIGVGREGDMSVSPTLPVDGWRVVLTWDAKPYDLDSHFYFGAGGTSCHMYWAKTYVSCSNGIGATLDVDDVNGFGPETSTLSHVSSGCTDGCMIKFVVNNYSRNPTLADSGAIVSLYNADSLIGEYKVGSSGKIVGNNWEVLEINGQTGEVNDQL